MPRMNGTGPVGGGPLTGRGLGNCTEANENVYGRGMGRGIGRSRGMRLLNGFRRGISRVYPDQQPTMTDEDALMEEKEALQRRLELINKQLGK